MDQVPAQEIMDMKVQVPFSSTGHGTHLSMAVWFARLALLAFDSSNSSDLRVLRQKWKQQ